MKKLYSLLDNHRLATKLVLAAVGAVLLGWDLFVYFSPEEGDTISAVTMDLSVRSKFLLVAIGVLLGHLLWPQRRG